MKRILLTGSAGYIGRVLSAALIKCELVELDRAFNTLDVAEDLTPLLEFQPDIIYHLAAQTSVQESFGEPTLYIRDNVLTTLNLIQTFPHAKIIFTSSAAVYGDNIIPTPETATPKPVNLYGFTKLMSEEIIKYSVKNYVILRLSNVYGGEGGKGVFFNLKKGSKIQGSGQNTRDYVYLNDVIEALLMAQNWPSDVYNISTGIETSVNRVADLLKVSKNYGPAVEEQARSCLDNRKAILMGWQPKKWLPKLTPL